MAPFSAVIITYNERQNIGPCLTALSQVAADIVIVDAYSTDDTVERSRQFGARVFQRAWQGYAKAKNYGNSCATYDWVLSIDADEVLSEALIATLQQWSPQPQSVYVLDRITNYCGRWISYSGWYPDWKPRLFDRRAVAWAGDYVHETLQIPPDYTIARLEGQLLHYSYKTSAGHLARIEKYAGLAAQELHAKGRRATVAKLWLSPIFRFLRTYFIKRGFLDGAAGYTISKRNAYLVHLKYQKLRELNQKNL